MGYKSTILKVLNIEKSETKYVTWTVLYSFFLGAAIAYFFTGSTSLFLNIFEREMIPLSFIIAGVIVLLVGRFYSFLQKKIHFSNSITGALAFLFVSVLVFYLLFMFFHSVVIVFVLYAWNRIFAYIHNVVFWGMAGKLFSIQQAKRVFGLISGGEVVGFILAFFSIPFLMKIIDTEALLFIATVFLLAGLLVLFYIAKKFKVKFDQVSNKATKSKKKVVTDTKKKPGFLSNNYYKLFFVIAFLPIFAQFFVDFVFQAQAKIEYPDKEKLSAFVGLFFGMGALFEFVLKAFISGRLLSKYGIKFGLLAFPLVLAFSFALATIFGFVYGAASLFFSFVALGRLFSRSIRTSFNDPATQILYQPLPPDERTAFQNKIESGPKAYASMVAGVFLFLLAKVEGLSLVYFSAFLLLIIAIWSKSATAIYKEYRAVLQSVLSKRKVGTTEKNDSQPTQLLKETVETPGVNKNEVIKLFRLVIPYETDSFVRETERLSTDGADKREPKFSHVIELSKSDEPLERAMSAKSMTKYSIYKVEKPIVRLLHDENFAVKCEAIIAAGKMRESELSSHLLSLFHNPVYKETVSAALINTGEAIIADLDHNFQKTEYDVSLQFKIVELIERIAGKNAIVFFAKNINYHNKLVSDRIIQALGNLQYRAKRKEASIIWRKLEGEIKNYVFVASALLNLKKANGAEDLYKALENEKNEKRRKVFLHLSVLYDPLAIRLIAETLESSDKNSHGFALEVADMVFSEMHKPMLFPLLESRNDMELVQKYALYYPMEKLSVVDQLADIINSEYWVTGFYTKCCALKMLEGFNEPNLDAILVANLVHPNKMMWQLASYVLYKKNPDLFYKAVDQNFPKVPGLKEFSESVGAYLSKDKSLLFSKLKSIHGLGLFNNIAEEYLVEMATTSIEIKLEQGKVIEMAAGQIDFYVLISGEMIDGQGKVYKKDRAICPYLALEGEKLSYKVTSPKAKLIKIDLHFVTNLFVQKNDFAKDVVKALWKSETTKNEMQESPTGTKNVNVM